jgi:hypothetical protein
MLMETMDEAGVVESSVDGSFEINNREVQGMKVTA